MDVSTRRVTRKESMLCYLDPKYSSVIQNVENCFVNVPQRPIEAQTRGVMLRWRV